MADETTDKNPLPKNARSMTGNAYIMTVPQLDKIIGMLKTKLGSDEIKKNITLTTKINNLLGDYVKAKNRILRYYEKAIKKHPELVRGKMNTLTLLDIYKNAGRGERAANKFARKNEKFSYNMVDWLRDTRGYAIGIGATTVALGAANAISTAVASKGIFELVGKAIADAFVASPLSASLIALGAVVTASALVIPAISRSAQKIRKNRMIARELNNEVLQERQNNDIDVTKEVADIKQVLLENDELRKELRTNIGSYGFTSSQKAKVMAALEQADAEKSNQEKEDYAEAGKAKLKAAPEEKIEQYKECKAKADEYEKAEKFVNDNKDNIVRYKKLKEEEKGLKKAKEDAEAAYTKAVEKQKKIKAEISELQTQLAGMGTDPRLEGNIDREAISKEIKSKYEDKLGKTYTEVIAAIKKAITVGTTIDEFLNFEEKMQGDANYIEVRNGAMMELDSATRKDLILQALVSSRSKNVTDEFIRERMQKVSGPSNYDSAKADELRKKIDAMEAELDSLDVDGLKEKKEKAANAYEKNQNDLKTLNIDEKLYTKMLNIYKNPEYQTAAERRDAIKKELKEAGIKESDFEKLLNRLEWARKGGMYEIAPGNEN